MNVIYDSVRKKCNYIYNQYVCVHYNISGYVSFSIQLLLSLYMYTVYIK